MQIPRVEVRMVVHQNLAMRRQTGPPGYLTRDQIIPLHAVLSSFPPVSVGVVVVFQHPTPLPSARLFWRLNSEPAETTVGVVGERKQWALWPGFLHMVPQLVFIVQQLHACLIALSRRIFICQALRHSALLEV
jgi:hypothetical protein